MTHDTHDTHDQRECESRIRYLEKVERRMTERLNRIANLMPGRQRVWKLDHVAMLFDIEADLEAGAVAEREMRDLAVFVRRLEWDLGEMRDAVRGDDRRMSGNRNDPGQWKGPRP